MILDYLSNTNDTKKTNFFISMIAIDFYVSMIPTNFYTSKIAREKG